MTDITFAGMTEIADYNPGAGLVTLSQSSQRPGDTTTRKARAASIPNQKAGVAGALGDLDTAQTGLYYSDPPYFTPSVIGALAGIAHDGDQKGIQTANGLTLISSTTTPYVVMLTATMRSGQRAINNATRDRGVMVALTDKIHVAHSGWGTTTPGQINLMVSGPGSTMKPIATGSQANMVCVIALLINPHGNAQAANGLNGGNIRAYVNGQRFGSDIYYDPSSYGSSAPATKLAIGNSLDAGQFDANVSDAFAHRLRIWAGGTLPDDAAMATAFDSANSLIGGKMGAAVTEVPTFVLGQSNGLFMYTGNYAEVGRENGTFAFAEAAAAITGGLIAPRDYSAYLTGPTAQANTVLLRSNEPAGSNNGAIDDTATPTSASWSIVTDNGRGKTNGYAYIWPRLALAPAYIIVDGENDGSAITSTSAYWKAGSGSPFTADTEPMRALRYALGHVRENSYIRSIGNASALALYVLTGPGGGFSGDLIRMAQIATAEQMPTRFALVVDSPFAVFQPNSNPSNSPHQSAIGYVGEERHIARRMLGILKAKGVQDSAVAYWQGAKLNRIVATAGKAYTDFVFDLPPNATTLILPASMPARGFEIARNATSVVTATIDGLTLTYNAYTAGSERNDGFTPTSITGATLVAPNTVRVAHSSVTWAAGDNACGWFGRAYKAAFGTDAGYGAWLADDSYLNAPAEPNTTSETRTPTWAAIEPRGMTAAVTSASSNASAQGGFAAAVATAILAIAMAGATITGAIPTSTTSPMVASAAAGSSAAGALPFSAALAPAAVVSGSSGVAGTFANQTAGAASGSAGGSGAISAAMPGATASPPTATAASGTMAAPPMVGATTSPLMGGAGGGAGASGALRSAASSPPAATIRGSAAPAGSFAVAVAYAPAGSAVAASGAVGAGPLPSVGASPPLASVAATGSAAGSFATATINPVAGRAAGPATALGALPTQTAYALAGRASGAVFVVPVPLARNRTISPKRIRTTRSEPC